MAQNYSRYNDGSQDAPKLRVGHSFWSLIKLPMNCDFDGGTEWTPDEKFARVRAADFAHMEFWLGDSNEAEVLEAIKRHDLRLVIGHRPYTVSDTRSTIERASRLGTDFVFMQPASASTPIDEVVEIAREGRKIAADHGLSCFVEVHRSNFTETLPQTLQLIEQVPEIRFTADLSHLSSLVNSMVGKMKTLWRKCDRFWKELRTRTDEFLMASRCRSM
jgi:hypothetical protein